MAAISAIAGKGIRVPAYAGCISRLLAPRVARPSRRQGRRSSSTRRQAVAFRTPLASPRRRRALPHLPPTPGGMACLTPSLRQPASGLPPQLRVPAAQSPSAPLQARYGLRPPRSFRGLRKPRSGSCSAGDEKNEKDKPSMHVNQLFCTFVRECVDNFSALRAKRRPVFQSVSCREERAESPNVENSRMPPV